MMCLSFSEEFFYAEGEGPFSLPPPSDRPASVCQALVSMPEAEFRACCDRVGVHPDGEAVINDLIDVIRRTDSCDDYSTPVTVYIDEDGDFSVTVY
jgi:hypothetical protein